MIKISPYFTLECALRNLGLADHRDQALPNSQWRGLAARLDGLQGPVVTADLVRVHPIEGDEDRNALVVTKTPIGWHVSVIAQDEVRKLWLMAPPDVRGGIRQVHLGAVELIRHEFEHTLKVHRPEMQCSLAYMAEIDAHPTSGQIPRVKTDILVSAWAYSPELGVRLCGETFSLTPSQVCGAADALTFLYHCRLSIGLEKQLGVEVRQGWGGLEIVGVLNSLRFDQACNRSKV